jgi:nicotinate-nucleotide pyrophosphorylase (carboxylating)
MTLNRLIEKRISEALTEDRARRDITTQALIPRAQKGEALVLAREGGVLCGTMAAKRCFTLLDRGIQYEARLKDGERFAPGTLLATIRGRLCSILSAERVAMNLLARLSGIATLTAAFVEKVRLYGTGIYDTRKTTPLWREMEKYAVRMGGGQNHRSDLAGAYFIKDNHVDARGGMKQVLDRFFNAARLRRPVIVEVRSLKEARIAADYPVDLLLLDNMSPGMIKGIMEKIKPRCDMEISGGIHLGNVERYARIGIPRISIGALTHSAKSLDISLEYHHSNTLKLNGRNFN